MANIWQKKKKSVLIRGVLISEVELYAKTRTLHAVYTYTHRAKKLQFSKLVGYFLVSVCILIGHNLEFVLLDINFFGRPS